MTPQPSIDDSDKIYLWDIIYPIERHWKLIIISSIFCSILAFGYAKLSKPLYITKTYISIGTVSEKELETVGQIKTIMNSPDIVSKIRQELTEYNNVKEYEVDNLIDNVRYSMENGFLRIDIISNNTTLSIRALRIIGELLLKRHQKIYEQSKNELKNTVKIMRDNLSPLTILTGIGISEFKMKPSTLVIEPYINEEPVWPKTKTLIITVFIITLSTTTFLSLMYEYLRKLRNQFIINK